MRDLQLSILIMTLAFGLPQFLLPPTDWRGGVGILAFGLGLCLLMQLADLVDRGVVRSVRRIRARAK